MIRDAPLARRLWARLEPIHAVTYFSLEAREALSAAGYKGFWMGYFAGRAAPMGAVGPEMVFATFYNFSLAHVRRAIPDADPGFTATFFQVLPSVVYCTCSLPSP